ncbi:unnamed protein product [Parnassius apollo]|uniref:(apollo) hypothetical protein n=1 Tax=Parnassius apollo TaxID=110799 RepID=A0A8S3XKS0_PARAO|nr:unnamed protein product [Parnassius apollo]
MSGNKVVLSDVETASSNKSSQNFSVAPPRPPRSLREKVLTKSTLTKATPSEKLSQPSSHPATGKRPADSAPTDASITSKEASSHTPTLRTKMSETSVKSDSSIRSSVCDLDLCGSRQIFQSELYALLRATKLAESSTEPVVNIMSDSRSSLDLLANSKASHPLSKAIQESIGKMRNDGRVIRLFWLRAHVGTSGNERADELAKAAALREKATLDYDKIPMSYVKVKIREETVKGHAGDAGNEIADETAKGAATQHKTPDYAKFPMSFVKRTMREKTWRTWQTRYESAEQGARTKELLPKLTDICALWKATKISFQLTQALTGHGYHKEYLHRFKIAADPF